MINDSEKPENLKEDHENEEQGEASDLKSGEEVKKEEEPSMTYSPKI